MDFFESNQKEKGKEESTNYVSLIIECKYLKVVFGYEDLKLREFEEQLLV